MKPTALAPTVALATPKIERFVRNNLMPIVGGTIQEIYECSPSTHDAIDGETGDEWVEGSWGVRVTHWGLSGETVKLAMNIEHPSISVVECSIKPEEGKLRVEFWLCARVMRG